MLILTVNEEVAGPELGNLVEHLAPFLGASSLDCVKTAALANRITLIHHSVMFNKSLDQAGRGR
jgi:hypothetical protein